MIESPDDNIYVSICVPTHEFIPYQFAFDLANMCAFAVHASGDRIKIQTFVQAGTYVHRARQNLIDNVPGAHYILWLDSDMRFPKETLLRLIQHDKPMVGINYSTRGVPPRFVAIKRVSIDHQEDGLGGKICATLEDSTGLEEVEAIGFGAVLMKAAIIPTLPTEGEPWFWYGLDKNDRELHVGEDVWFCRLVREAGWQIFVDHDLSKECAHVGVLEYKVQHAEGELERKREEDPDVDHLVYNIAKPDSELAEPE
jgi:hypothetical protein